MNTVPLTDSLLTPSLLNSSDIRKVPFQKTVSSHPAEGASNKLYAQQLVEHFLLRLEDGLEDKLGRITSTSLEEWEYTL